jgi:hypothetical protein
MKLLQIQVVSTAENQLLLSKWFENNDHVLVDSTKCREKQGSYTFETTKNGNKILVYVSTKQLIFHAIILSKATE